MSPKQKMEEVIQLKVVEIINETDSAITLILEKYPDKTTRIPYQSGQFITFLFILNGRELRRSYSISSSPITDNFFAVTIKKITNGEVSNYIFRFIKVGNILNAFPPSGRFILNSEPALIAKDYIFIAAGSGITPIFSMVKSLLANKSSFKILLIYSNHEVKSTLFYQQLEKFQEMFPHNFTCVYFFSSLSDRDKSFENRGHLNIQLLQKLISRNLHYHPDHAEFYLCGPFSFMRMADMVIAFMGFNEDKIHKENFTKLVEPLSEKFLNTLPPGNKRITYKKEEFTKTVESSYDKTLLQSGQEQGIKIPYSCKAGICGTCAVRCLHGNVRMSINEVLTGKDLREGLVLTCVGYAVSDQVTLEIL